jgi:hypothetical protein
LPKSAGRKKKYNNDRKSGNPDREEFGDVENKYKRGLFSQAFLLPSAYKLIIAGNLVVS